MYFKEQQEKKRKAVQKADELTLALKELGKAHQKVQYLAGKTSVLTKELSDYMDESGLYQMLKDKGA